MSNNNNIRILTAKEIEFFNKTYTFVIKDDLLLVSTNKQTTAHRVDKPFFINSKMRYMKFSVDAITKWREHFYGKYTLIEVQDAINRLIVSYQKPQVEEIEKMLLK